MPRATINDVPETVLRAVRAVKEAYGAWMLQYADFVEVLTESPIEAAMMVALSYLAEGKPRLSFKPQSLVGEFRVDFLLTYEGVRLVVECDGHDFHERTKEQARADRSRDRALAELGCFVMRFTGSEIYADALACARQAVEFVETKGIEAFWARQPKANDG